MAKSATIEAMEYFGVNDTEEMMNMLEEQHGDGQCEATDGCVVEPDGHCPHGKPSWLIKLGII
ncbi:MAG: hypothetical protein KZQ85_10830 [Candidatus Thiodiazotropha sp. (ex Myrtea sp. 'scaly one' KF741663)]|nr:hypothetical protein [Candidatus Thiodiazotropha sp. (ex Myrtea sp. 'scaly one' KF741663)]